jgi:hypothetical protein
MRFIFGPPAKTKTLTLPRFVAKYRFSLFTESSIPEQALRTVHFPPKTFTNVYQLSTEGRPGLFPGSQALPELYQPAVAPDGRFRAPSLKRLLTETQYTNQQTFRPPNFVPRALLVSAEY